MNVFVFTNWIVQKTAALKPFFVGSRGPLAQHTLGPTNVCTSRQFLHNTFMQEQQKSISVRLWEIKCF